jgi:pyruvate dehydrogenase E1 component alpha subunit
VIHTVDSLIAFRERVVKAFLDKHIRSPIHLPSDGQAEPLINIFQDFRPGVDWCFAGWRSMWHALLAGIPEDELFQMILDGRSMYLMDKRRRVFCSSIVGGILPIALGTAMAIKLCKENGRVFVFIGDMTARTGLFHEFEQFVFGHTLPVRVFIEGNGLSTDTPTSEAWGVPRSVWTHQIYRYQRNLPHVGVGQFVNF